MATNFSSSNSSSFSQHFSSDSSLNSFSDCIDSTLSVSIFTGFTITLVVLLFPLTIIIVHLGHQKHLQNRSASYCDIITYHVVAMETTIILASWMYCAGAYMHYLRLSIWASHLFLVTSCGQMLFLVLTCLDLHLAVVHPITYLQLKQGRGLVIKNSLVWFVWLLSFIEMMSFVTQSSVDYIFIVYFGHQVFSLAVTSFCSFSLLRALKRPGPGEGRGGREMTDQSKQRSFYIIMAIMATVLLRLVVNLVCSAIYSSLHINLNVRCVAIVSSHWFFLPSSLVVPLLFLQRAGKLSVCN